VHAVAGRQRADSVFRSSVGGQRHGRDLTAFGPGQLSHLADQRVAILAGHLDVRHEHVRLPHPQHRERFGRRRARHGLGFRAPEDRRDQIQGIGIVVHDEDT
jgi:hypothetical protein